MNPELKNKCVLIVDDDERNRYALSSYLDMLEMNVLVSDNGQDALALLRGRSDVVDLILLDIMMPTMDGYDVLKALRSDEALKDIPVIAVTARAMTQDCQRCLEAGASDYVAKPIDLKKFVATLAKWL